MVENYLQVLKWVGSFLIVIPVLLGLVAVAVSRANKDLSIRVGGFYGQVVLGGIGVMIHELSHLIVAVVFGHHIQSVSLLHIPNVHNPADRGLGHVGHVWNDENLYQKVGNVFIGIAPVIGCALVMVWSTKLLVPQVYNRWLMSVGDPRLMAGNSTWWQWLLWIILMVNISVGGFDLSAADLANSRQGLIALVVIILLGSFIASLFIDPQTIFQKLSQLTRPFDLVLVFAIVVNIGLWAVLQFLVHLKAR